MPELSTKERETIQLASLGFSNAEVAQLQHVSLETIKARMKKARSKLNAHNKAHAVAVALRQGEIE